MSLVSNLRRLAAKIRPTRPPGGDAADEPTRIAQGWDEYAKSWKPEKFKVLEGYQIRHLGDEWTAEDVSEGGTTYGLAPESIEHFDDCIDDRLLRPYLPAQAEQGLEIGPGGGRLTALLLPRTAVLHVADPSDAMLCHLQQRFNNVAKLRVHHIDGMTLPRLQPSSLDYVIALDVFVHFEPRLIYWYLRQIVPLLKPGGTGIVHYSNTLTPIGWQQFEDDLETNVHGRQSFGAFGVMCPPLMEKFLETLRVDVISLDLGLLPRDAVTVFRRPAIP